MSYGQSNFENYNKNFLDFIKDHRKDSAIFLDIGGGSGRFARLLKDKVRDIHIIIVDPSIEMLNLIDDDDITKIVGELPGPLNLPSINKADFILLEDVLHHITGKSIKISKELVIESLNQTKKQMDKNGFLLIEDIFYEGYGNLTIPRTIIFYLLRIQNIIKIRFLPKEFLLGLNVCFYTRPELFKILDQCGFKIIFSKEIQFANSLKKKALLLKNWGKISLIVIHREG